MLRTPKKCCSANLMILSKYKRLQNNILEKNFFFVGKNIPIEQMQSVSTEDMCVRNLWYWIGDVIREAETIYSSSTSVEKYIVLGQYLCNNILYLKCKLIGFRSVTRNERDLSRFHRSIDFLGSLRCLNRTSHLMLLVEMPDEQRAQLMFSCSLEEPQSIECIDIDKVRVIRFVIWVGIQISEQFCIDTSFMAVWCTNVLPLCHVSCETNKHKVLTSAWEVSKRLKSEL